MIPAREKMNREMSEEDIQQLDEEIDRWIKEHASEEMWLYLEYCDRVSDEGQLCD